MCPQNIVKLCECGCGEPAPLSRWSDKTLGYVKGEPKRFVYRHQPGRPIRDWQERFWEKVERRGGSECWPWTSTVVARYGQFRMSGGNGKRVKAHRLAYELLVGPIPEGLVIDHLCKNTLCCNPTHMEPVTNVENVLRGDSIFAVNARKTHCKRGHEFTPENTRVLRRGRVCRVCVREQARTGRPKGARGEKNTRAKLTEAQALAILARAAGGESQRQLGLEFGVSRVCINDLVTGRRWGHLQAHADSVRSTG